MELLAIPGEPCCPCGAGLARKWRPSLLYGVALRQDASGLWYVQCCECRRRTSLFKTEDEAIDAWKTMLHTLTVQYRQVDKIVIAEGSRREEGPEGWEATAYIQRVLTDGSKVSCWYMGYSLTSVDGAFADLKREVAERESGWIWK
jgi:hypothetical protein